jgi:hypothetical protein
VPETRVLRTAWGPRLLGPALLIVLATDLVGGLLDVVAGRSSLTAAWGSSATLCAPWPMIAFQIGAFLLIRRGPSTLRWVAAGLLMLACVVSVLSGFFDGQLGRADLGAGERGFQVWLLVATGALGCAAATAPFVNVAGPADQNSKRTRSAASHAATGASPHS